MSKYKYLLWDIDGTVLNFVAAEEAAIKSLFLKHGFGECSDEMLGKYSEINLRYWQALERNEMTKAEILVGRFEEFFGLYGLDTSKASAFNADYQLALGDTIVFCDNAMELLKGLKDSGAYVLAAITNGTKVAQEKKLLRSGLNQIFEAVFISEEVGVEKPNVEFFDLVEKELHINKKEEVLVIGDSLTSDILGGINMGVDTCWYNPSCKEANKKIPATYEIRDLHEIAEILA